MQPQALKQMTPELVNELYKVIGAKPPEGRALNRVVVILEANKPVTIEERTFPVADVPTDGEKDVLDAVKDQQAAAAAPDGDKPAAEA